LFHLHPQSRIPLAGLFLAACSGILWSDNHTDSWIIFGTVFCLLALLALAWPNTLLTLAATALFFVFWSGFLLNYDQGFQLSRENRLSSHIHRCVLCAQSDSRSVRWANQIRQHLLAEVRAVDGFPVRFRVAAELNGNALRYGDGIAVDGRLALPEEALNPGEFDYRNFLQRQGVYLTLHAIPGGKTELLAGGSANLLISFALHLRRCIEHIPTAALDDDPPIQGLIQGILFGDRSNIPPSILDELQDTGTLHLFVIDGLKVALLAGISWAALRMARVGHRWAFILVLPLLLYCAGTGLSIAGLRATIMAGIVLFGVALERPALGRNIVSGAGLILLLFDPRQLFQLGFQLSFVTVACLTIAARPFAHLLALPFRPDPWIPQRLLHPVRRAFWRITQHCCELSSVCCVCWLATLPFSWLIFHRVSWYSVAANFVTVPIGASMLALGIASIVAAPFCHWASICLNHTNWLCGHLFLTVVHSFTSLPYQSVNVGEPGARNSPMVVILASGRSNSIYLHSGTADCFINPGSDAKYRRVTQPFLRYQGVNRLFLIPSSRCDPDHEGCLKQIQRQFACTRLVDQPVMRSEPTIRDRKHEPPRTIELDETGIRTAGLSTDRNASGLPILVRMGVYRILLLADCHRGSAMKVDTQPVDAICAGSPRSFPPADLRRKFDPQVIVYEQGKPTESSSAIHFLNQQGAARFELCGDSLRLRLFHGDQFVFRRRN
jgi:ComEC/Rec2-related protein